jgi:hypothetical protein
MRDQSVVRPLPIHRIDTNIYASSEIRAHNPSVGVCEDRSCLRPRGLCDRQSKITISGTLRFYFFLYFRLPSSSYSLSFLPTFHSLY